MIIGGLTDSLADLSASPGECPGCHATSRIAHGLCLGCLLRAAAGEEEEESGVDDFDAVLAALAVADIHWRLGNYEILEEIGRGGMGVIYRARQRHSRRIVALKRVLSYHADSHETLTRFRREAEAAASLDHPNILPIYEVGESAEGVPYFSMKFAPGGSLQEVGPALRGNSREVVRLVAKVTRAVQYAHRQGILHRDLKPGNILLDSRSEPMVSDFGLAKWLDTSSNLTRTLTIFGTPGYIAPEQAKSVIADLRPTADVYSLGAILFFLLSGQPPFLGEHALAVIHQAAEKTAPRLRSLVKGADRDLETICARCLEREPGARYQSAGDLAEDLERWLEGRPIIARPVSPITSAWRWARRKPALAASIVGLLALVAVIVTRQLETHRLAAEVQENQLAAHSVAVFPFLNLDQAKADPSIGPVIAEALQRNLSGLGPARVTALKPNPSFAADTASLADIREANRSQKARAILTGSVRALDGKWRISLRVLNAATGDAILTKSLEGIPNIAAVGQAVSALAQPIHDLLQLSDWSDLTQAGRDPGLKDDRAREFIVSGRQLMFRDSVRDLDRSIRCLEKAIALEPRSAIAHAYLAATVGGQNHFNYKPALLDRAEKEARKALSLEPDLAAGHRALAGMFYERGEYTQALDEQLRAVETGGADELAAANIGMTLIASGKPMKALGWLEMARQSASRPGDYDAPIGDCWSELGDDEKAATAYQRAMDLRPERSDGWVGLCHLWLMKGDNAAARELCQQNRAISSHENSSDTKPDQIAAQIEFFSRNYTAAEQIYRELAERDPSNGGGFYGAMSYDSAVGRLQELLGDPVAGLTTLRRARSEEMRAPAGAHTGEAFYRIAAIESSLGNTDAALDYFRLAIDAGWSDFRSPRLDPRFDSIAANPRFTELVSGLAIKMADLRKPAPDKPSVTHSAKTL